MILKEISIAISYTIAEGTKVYASSGQLEEEKVEKDGVVYYHERYHFDSVGLITKKEELQVNTSSFLVSEHHYDDQLRLIRVNRGAEVFKYSYDVHGTQE